MQNNTTLKTPGGQVAGIVFGDTLRIVKTDARTHFVKKFGGYGISPRTLDEAEQIGATRVLVIVQETGREFSCTIREWREYAIPADLGYGRQLFMPLRSFKYCNSNKNQLHKNEPVPVQFSLFG